MNYAQMDELNDTRNYNRTSIDFNGAGQKKIGGIARRFQVRNSSKQLKDMY